MTCEKRERKQRKKRSMTSVRLFCTRSFRVILANEAAPRTKLIFPGEEQADADAVWVEMRF